MNDLFGIEACREQEQAIRAEEAAGTPLVLSRPHYEILVGNDDNIQDCTKMVRDIAKARGIEPDESILSKLAFIMNHEIEFFMIGSYKQEDYEQRETDPTNWVVGFSVFEIVVETFEDAMLGLTIIYQLLDADVHPWTLPLNSQEFKNYFAGA